MASIAVVGMWHLGPVTAACLASTGHTVVAIDEDPDVIGGLAQARIPVNEPELAEMIARELKAGRLRFSTRLADVVGCEVVWIAFDTPVDDKDRADPEFVFLQALRVLEHVREGTVFVVSSQMPAGSVARLEKEHAAGGAGKSISFACAPENLRLGSAIEVFLQPDRVVLGVRDKRAREVLREVYQPFCNRLEWMSVESAEMTKHAINAFLATSVCFINELAALCETAGGDAMEVERGLKTDSRIGHRAYLHAGHAIGGGTLARDIDYLRSIARSASAESPLFDGVHASNEHHKRWLERKIFEVMGGLSGRTMAVLGLTYKPGTNTLRRSLAVETARWLHREGVNVRAFDPQITQLPEDLRPVMSLGADLDDTLRGADALVVATAWPEFQSLDPSVVPKFVFDASRFLEKQLSLTPNVRYYAIGRAH